MVLAEKMSEKVSEAGSRRFGGIARLYGEQALARLAAAHIGVIGIGGVGSWAAEALARSGIGRLTLIDLDHVAESNLNRQIHAVESTLGQAKVLAMKDRIAMINPACEVTTIEEFVAPDNVADILPGCDAVVDAIDQVRAKAALIVHCRRLGIPLVTTGGAGGKSDPAMIRVDDLARTTQDPLAAKLRAALRRDYGFPRKGARFGVDCVYSLEPVRRPEAAACDVDEGNEGLHGLNCAGYGSSVCVTAGFGFAAASRVLARCAQLMEAR
ncbi:MAG: tRNA cyclic N6-threonylcarbamoyladenosine(37) synthase TcdA [Rhodocyclaceae bacterium]|nr:tRNA cyclic N6-threonylcarbamoyladenosine(37) synthase TcdA [Rhodocyclaceae bacterium]